MTSPQDEKAVLARRWLAEPEPRISAEERAFLEEFVRRYPGDPGLTPPERRRLVREYALLAERLGAGT